jgi:hypothetical protein
MSNDLICKTKNVPAFNPKFRTMFLLFLIAAIMTIVVSEIAGVNYDFAEDDNENGGNSYDFAEDDNENGDDSPEESNGGKKKEDGCKIDYC